MSLSIFIICKNEEKIIEACLKQAKSLLNKISDPRSEIIVVDSGSTDTTLEIVKNYTDKVYHQDWLGYAQQKNYALSLCENEWVLSLDADEVLTDKSINEIYNSLMDILNPPADFSSEEITELKKIPGFMIARKLFIADKFIRWGGYYPDYQLRLFKKELGHFTETKVHESIELKGYSKTDLIKLKEPLDHYSYADLEELKLAFKKYAALANSGLANEQKGLIKAYRKYIYTFLLKFIFRLGFLHGILGLKLALIHANYAFNKYKA